jgi:hypothetical protein
MKHTLPGQLDLPETPERPGKPAAKALPVQRPCDLGLFSDDARQIDIIDILASK